MLAFAEPALAAMSSITITCIFTTTVRVLQGQRPACLAYLLVLIRAHDTFFVLLYQRTCHTRMSKAVHRHAKLFLLNGRCSAASRRRPRGCGARKLGFPLVNATSVSRNLLIFLLMRLNVTHIISRRLALARSRSPGSSALSSFTWRATRRESACRLMASPP